jgi:acetoin utilization protein AcuC
MSGERVLAGTGDYMTNLILVHSDAYAGWVFSDSHPTQGRRFDNARERLLELAASNDIKTLEIESDYFPERALLERVHSSGYVSSVLEGGECGEWSGERHDLGNIAHRMVGGTILAADALIKGKTRTAVHFPGAKHHAQRDHSSGFCVFADLAITAKYLLDGVSGVRRISIIDIDAHHGDGTEALLRDDPRVQTMSVHDRTIFPGTGHADDADREVFNEALPYGSGNSQLTAAVARFIGEVQRFAPDLLMLALGADGHDTDPLSTLTYSIDGMVDTVRKIREAFPELPILIGGAGGYQPDNVTPEVWARMAIAVCS